MLYELIYLSLASWNMTSDDLDEIIKEACDKNIGRQITGCLYYCDRTFIQVLEGEKDKVIALFDRISKDKRHQKVDKIFEGPIAERAFSDFSMGLFVDESKNFAKELDQLIGNFNHKESVAKTLFESLVKEVL